MTPLLIVFAVFCSVTLGFIESPLYFWAAAVFAAVFAIKFIDDFR